MSDGRLIRVARSTAFLPEDGPLRRMPRATRKPRPPTFVERFEDRALVYDAFWHADGARILLVGPPDMNLRGDLARAQYSASPSGAALSPGYHRSLSTMTTVLSGAPSGTTAVRMRLDGSEWELPVGANFGSRLAGRCILFGMNKDNDLGWIAEWARWHATMHGTDAIVLFDNGSTSYAPEQAEETLLGIAGISIAAVPRWPGKFGMTDHALAINPYWSHFLQIASMGVVLRRFGSAAAGILNCDIDELAATRSRRTIYDLLDQARRGLVVFRGQWIEATGDPRLAHRGFVHRHRDPRVARSSPGKWVIDPKRDWFANLGVHPYWHWVEGRPWFGKTMPADAQYWHFKGINTNWKEARTAAPAASELEPDPDLIESFARVDASWA